MSDYDEYKEWLKHKRKKNGEKILNSTSEVYLYTAKDFFNANLDRKDFLDYMNRKIKMYSSNIHHACFKSILEFYDFDEDKIKTLKSPKYTATALKSERMLQSKVLSIFEMKALIQYIRAKDGEGIPSVFENICKFKMSALESEVLLRLLYDTACRKGEIISTKYNREDDSNLKVKNIDFKSNELNVMGKGRKRRIVPIATTTAELLKNLIEVKKLKDDDDVIIFTKEDGTPYVNQEYECWKFIKLISHNALNRKMSPHSLRHTRLTHFADEGADLLDLKEMAGHSSPNTTMIYLKISNWRRRKAIEKYAFDLDDKEDM